MKKHFFILGILCLTAMLTSCNKEFQQINTNPNNLESPDPGSLLSNILVSEFYNNVDIAWTLGNGYSQYMTFSQDYYNTGTRYLPVTNEPYWIPMYEAARDANLLYNTSLQQQNPLMEAVALTLRSYAFAQLTELWGDIPYTRALQGNTGNFTPPYDPQQTVYMDPQIGILACLRRADSLLKSAPPALLNGDILYQGNATSWRRFINALRLRYLLRVSSQTNVSAEIQSIVTDGTLMQSASQSATIVLPPSLPYNFPSLTERFGDFQVKYMNSTLYNVFVSTGDSARMVTYFAENSTGVPGMFSYSYYGGMPMVVNASNANVISSSNFNSSFRSGDAKVLNARIMTYAEQEFDLAEAALKGMIPGSAATYYQDGIIGAYNEIGLTSSQASAYLANPAVALNLSNPDTALSQIITQKWLVNINNAFEGWIEYRRTGYPQFQTGGSVNLNGGVIPSRFLYPTTEKSINAVNYNKEIQVMGGTEVTTYKAWWEK
ncbi:MAG TPA: SusD/RagB family nutrient-binding outer membrane lipoprotein [Chitinophagaceae bacterium]|nr:SusD/RagB family nutrient-binding outer membrane lipoprotein [Chitinophagaceae bacterium]